MKNWLSIFLLKGVLLMGFFNSNAQHVEPNFSKSLAMSNSVVSQSAEEFVPLNPAAASLGSFTVGINYNNRFLLPALSTSSLLLVVPVSQLKLLTHISQFGSESFQETLFECGAAQCFGGKLSMGLTFKYYHFRAAELEEQPQYLTFNLGAQYHGSDFGLGCSFQNLFGEHFNSEFVQMNYHGVAIVGAHRKLRAFTLSAQICASRKKASTWHLGAEYRLNKTFSLLSGFQSGAQNFSFGFTFVKHKIGIASSCYYHHVLGLSPSISFLFKGNRDEL